ncbi:MAG: CoA ester lyase [Deltaproteobacteria bacterium]|nr:CoA ester lyase [Deltaproteobacteria bacterium]MBW2308020.1 CoA ester lyase [Deltaproteobacteria bacterium]
MGLKIRRSTLIFPVNVRKFVEKAYTRGADAISLDLEDSIPPSEKTGARKLVREAIPMVARGGAEVLVRVNNDPDLICEDIDAVVYPGLNGIRFPKVESAEQVHRLDALLEAKERERGIPPKSISISARIETPLGLLHARSIAEASSRIDTFGVGPEDYSFALGVEPSEDGMELLYAVSKVVAICKAMGIMANGLLGSVAGFRDMEGFERAAVRGRQLGTVGASAIHPDQIAILHRVFSPSPESVEHARRVVQAFEDGLQQGTASVALDGKMVDIPVYYRAKKVMERAEAIEAVERKKAQALAKIA